MNLSVGSQRKRNRRLKKLIEANRKETEAQNKANAVVVDKIPEKVIAVS